ncbi:MAG: ornithine carbamoyltransferase [Candidatus Aquicultorales bacterium]
MGSLSGKDFLSIDGLGEDELFHLLSKSIELKRSPRSAGRPLEGDSIALVFHKPSMRTRVSFETAATSLGAHPIFLRQDEIGLGDREPVEDIGRVLARYVRGVVVRTFAQSIVEGIAENSSVPVINALTDEEHPCQALADLMTVLEKKGRLAGIKVAFIGDGGNNVCHSLMLAAAKTGMSLAVGSPPGHEPNKTIVDKARSHLKSGQTIELANDPRSAVSGADVVYTDVWVSMGQERERNERLKAFAGFQVDAALLSKASDEAILMHCLPAHRGEEVSGEAMESKASVVFDQAENRLHTAKAVLLEFVGDP